MWHDRLRRKGFAQNAITNPLQRLKRTKIFDGDCVILQTVGFVTAVDSTRFQLSLHLTRHTY
jgi:hypothetical protein